LDDRAAREGARGLRAGVRRVLQSPRAIVGGNAGRGAGRDVEAARPDLRRGCEFEKEIGSEDPDMRNSLRKKQSILSFRAKRGISLAFHGAESKRDSSLCSE